MLEFVNLEKTSYEGTKMRRWDYVNSNLILLFCCEDLFKAYINAYINGGMFLSFSILLDEAGHIKLTGIFDCF